MNSQLDPDIFDDLFHACALAAFLQEARSHQAWLDREQTRRRAYRLYEQELACRRVIAVRIAGVTAPTHTTMVSA